MKTQDKNTQISVYCFDFDTMFYYLKLTREITEITAINRIKQQWGIIIACT
jgi:hypothetical protein